MPNFHHAPYIFMIALFISFSTATSAQPDVNGVLDNMLQLKADHDHEFLKTLSPTREQLGMVLISDEAVEKMMTYVDQKFGNLDQLPDNAMKPMSIDAGLSVYYATKEDLQRGQTKGLESGYTMLAPYLKNGVIVYCAEYFNTDGESEKSRAAFFKCGDEWIFIPRAFMAFEEE